MNHILIKQTVTFAKKKSLLVNTLLIKIIVKLGTTVITQVNAEMLHVAYVIWNKIYLKKFLWFFTVDLTPIMILS